jgi:hypothetical protein
MNPYVIEITKEDILPLLNKMIFDLMLEYNLKDGRDLFGFALGPNAYKSFVFAISERQRVLDTNGKRIEITQYRGCSILVSPYAGIVPLFTDRAWSMAHCEAKKWMNKEGLN